MTLINKSYGRLLRCHLQTHGYTIESLADLLNINVQAANNKLTKGQFSLQELQKINHSFHFKPF